jgi:hypothetical protein
MSPWRRRRRDGAESAKAAASESLEQARDDLAAQRAAAIREHRDVILPLRRMRERNHIAEQFIRSIRGTE